MELSREAFRAEVNRFRSAFKEEALDTAQKSLTLEKRGNVGVIIFDQFEERANKLSTPNMLRLFDLLLEVEKDSQIGALVIISRKPTIFIAGADISEISRMASGEVTAESLMKLQAVFTYLENLPIPSVAAIHGACMGGGTELALACDYRIMTDAPESKMALPEVQLGVLPGWGGTQRLPRLIGLEKALDMILTGKAMDGRKAKKIGLVDKNAPKELLEQKAIAWATELAKTKKKREFVPPGDLKEKILTTVPGGKWLVFETAKKEVMKKTKGNYPAPLAILNVLRKTYGGPLEAGLKVEAEAFIKLVTTPESQNLIRIFYLTEKVKKDRGAEAPAKEIRHAAVLGAGIMGGGIAQLFAAKDVRTLMKDVAWPAIAKGFKAAHKIFKKQVDRKKIKPNELDNRMALVEGTTDYAGFKNTDLVVEAIVEDLDIKKKVFAELDNVTPANAILATNTSSLSVTKIAEAVKDPSRVVGMHFFNPVDKMPLVEVIRGAKTSDAAVSTIYQFSKKLGKTPIVVKDAPGFVVNRILAPYMVEASHMIMEGLSPEDIDDAMEQFGMPMGPCELIDEVGIDVGAKVTKTMYGAFGERLKPPSLLDSLIGDGRLGKKTGKGIYNYESDKRTLDGTLSERYGIKFGEKKLAPETIQKRLLYLMTNEAARVLDEDLVRDVSDIDIGMIFGTGFAPFRGGLLRYADEVGIDNIVTELELFTRNIGERYKPCSYLQQLSVGTKTFYKN